MKEVRFIGYTGFTDQEKEYLELYFRTNKMYVDTSVRNERIDCRFLTCDDCIFDNKCIIGGLGEDEILKKIQEVLPEYFI
jgi:hypothetical protein